MLGSFIIETTQQWDDWAVFASRATNRYGIVFSAAISSVSALFLYSGNTILLEESWWLLQFIHVVFSFLQLRILLGWELLHLLQVCKISLFFFVECIPVLEIFGIGLVLACRVCVVSFVTRGISGLGYCIFLQI